MAMVPRELPRDRHGECTIVRSHGVLHRELSYPEDERSVHAIKRVKVGCSCGWRSSELHVPFGTMAYFFPFVCGFQGPHAEQIEDRAAELWHEHVRSGSDEHWLTGWRRREALR